MDEIKKIRGVAIWIFLIPFVSINLCLLIVINHSFFDDTIFQVDVTGRLNFSIPYFTGGFSISRAARAYPCFYIFKFSMVITSLILIRYWLLNKQLITNLSDIKISNLFTIFGITSAVFLIFHALMLGIKFELSFLKFFRRFVLIAFILFEIAAQTLLIINLFKLKYKIKNLISNKILICKSIMVSVLIIVAFASIPILVTEEYKNFKHALEWNYFVGVVLFYLLTNLMWKNPNHK